MIGVQCIDKCDDNDTQCRNLCSRDSTTCVDRCPCHDKCSWGCPCGFYQCDPHCEYAKDDEFARECGKICIQRADDHVAKCINIDHRPEQDCYSEGNDISINCMKDCPCGENCPVCNEKDLNSPKECKDFCPDKITDMDKCLEVWGVEERQCMEACDAPRNQCYDGCDSGPCKDQCDDTWIEAELCCHRQCPCHAKCSGGCPCAGDDCGLINIDGNDFCGINEPKPEWDCITENAGDVERCVRPCREQSYTCALACKGNRVCLDNCQQEENECKKSCPCYADCPQGCPCAGWCGEVELICGIVNQEFDECCEEKCYQKREKCKDDCPINSDLQDCKDQCLEDEELCTGSCPCHKKCRNGCPCNNANTWDNTDCCDDFQVPLPENQWCVDLWGEEIRQCRDHCTHDIAKCLSFCGDNDQDCRNKCREENFKCISSCPCFEFCPNGCPCWPDISNFCPTDDPRPSYCTENHAEEIQKCVNYCYTQDRNCVLACAPNDNSCIKKCYDQAIECPKDCPCYENCPNGCPCGYKDIDCHEFNPNLPYGLEEEANEESVSEWAEDIRAKSWSPDQYQPRIIWCEDFPINKPQPDRHCNIFWEPEITQCMGYCQNQYNLCIPKCGGNAACEDKCQLQKICCEDDCPCNVNCINGCDCPWWIPPEHNFCPDNTDKDCIADGISGIPNKQCEDDCYENNYECLTFCHSADRVCINNCRTQAQKCYDHCPCNRDCRRGCKENRPGYCVPGWDEYCPITTTPATTTKTTTTTTTTTVAPPITDPPAPDVDPIDGDAILILHDDKAMLHNWPKNDLPKFHNLRNGFNDFNAVFDFNDYWPHEACSVQFKGKGLI